jgi:hypothetical protein
MKTKELARTTKFEIKTGQLCSLLDSTVVEFDVKASPVDSWKCFAQCYPQFTSTDFAP